MLSSLLLLGKAMKLEVLCEGVETPEQLALLQQLGVRLARAICWAGRRPRRAVSNCS